MYSNVHIGEDKHVKNQGPVIQSIVSLKRSLVISGQNVNCYSKYNI